MQYLHKCCYNQVIVRPVTITACLMFLFVQLNDARSEDFDRVISCSVFDNLIRESGSRRVISVSELPW